MIYVKLYIKTFYSPPHEQEIWHYHKGNIQNIIKSTDQFSWVMRFTNIDVMRKWICLTKIENTFNYTLHETINCDDKDPPWINKDIKELIHDKNQAHNSYRQNINNTFSFYQFEFLQSKLYSLVENLKLNYYACLSKILSDLKLSEIALVYIRNILE